MALNLSWGGRSDDEHAGNMIKAKFSKAMIAMIAMAFLHDFLDEQTIGFRGREVLSLARLRRSFFSISILASKFVLDFKADRLL